MSFSLLCSLSPNSTLQTAASLESLCVASIQAVNERKHDFRQKELSKNHAPNFKAHIDANLQLSFAEQSNLYRKIAEISPTFHIELVQLTSDIREEAGTASVFMQTAVTGVPGSENSTIQWMSEAKWKRERGIWLCTSVTGIRGISAYNGIM